MKRAFAILALLAAAPSMASSILTDDQCKQVQELASDIVAMRDRDIPVAAVFSHALPHLPRHELVTRVQLSLRALACVMADANIGELVAAICMGEPVNDSLVVTRLLVFVSPILTAPFGDQEQARQVEEVMGKVAVTEHVVDSRMHAGRARATEHKALRDDDLVMNCALFHSINDAIYPPLSSEMPVAAASALDEAADAGYPRSRWRLRLPHQSIAGPWEVVRLEHARMYV